MNNDTSHITARLNKSKIWGKKNKIKYAYPVLFVGHRVERVNVASTLLFPTYTPLRMVHTPTEASSIHVKPYVNGFLAFIQMRYDGAGESASIKRGDLT
jgi:hypothetical protein